ncbi:DUF4232 domain-containing protein [Streptomyces sp. NPDC059564]|uniref:DUF4232 domain-containing protein n=1 Tax=Streptomyces sp. NPDC059564 TaxID=3346865 RepID=UPI00368BEC70
MDRGESWCRPYEQRFPSCCPWPWGPHWRASVPQVGKPADRDGQVPAAVSLAPGRSATATLHTTNGPIGGPCLPKGAFLKVYPPASTEAVLLNTPFQVCSNLFTVSPVTA